MTPDKIVRVADVFLRTVFIPTEREQRPCCDAPYRTKSAALMRVNHAGEVCAQALYEAQAAGAGAAWLQADLQGAAKEELQHLRLTGDRLAALGESPSRVTGAWFAGSFAIGTMAAFAGDDVNLGFLAETERRVDDHLAHHLVRLHPADVESRNVLRQMQADERGHADLADSLGAKELNGVTRTAMRVCASVMKSVSARG